MGSIPDYQSSSYYDNQCCYCYSTNSNSGSSSSSSSNFIFEWGSFAETVGGVIIIIVCCVKNIGKQYWQLSLAVKNIAEYELQSLLQAVD